MSQHGIETIKIENFKCFEHLEINGFKRLNLIGGKNNVGKTALLEVINLLVIPADSYSLFKNTNKILEKRQQALNSFVESGLFFNSNSPILVSSKLLKITIMASSSTNEVFFKCGDQQPAAMRDSMFTQVFNPKHLKANSGFFIEPSALSSQDISALYGHIIESSNEIFLNNSLKIFDNRIDSFKVVPTLDKVVPKIKLINSKSLVDLSTLGEGVNRYIAILCAIWASQDGYLFIDEIENGIHYTNYPKLWELIFLASAQANCQVFVTSHSKECITAFNNTQLLEANKDRGSYFELFYSQKKQRISAAYRDAEQLKYALDHNEDIRGE